MCKNIEYAKEYGKLHQQGTLSHEEICSAIFSKFNTEEGAFSLPGLEQIAKDVEKGDFRFFDILSNQNQALIASKWNEDMKSKYLESHPGLTSDYFDFLQGVLNGNIDPDEVY